MADSMIDLELVSGLGLPYEPGAEAALAPDDAAAFAGVSATAGTMLTLVPTFDGPVFELADFLAAARQGGAEPPDLFSWYSIACPADVVEAVVAALEALPFVVQAWFRPITVPAGWEVASDPDTNAQFYLRRPLSGINAFAAWQVPGGSGRGVRVVDVERFWDLAHRDLKPADVTALSPLPQPASTFDFEDRDHGTASLGIVGARSTGVGLTGIVPHAALAVSPDSTSFGSAIRLAAGHAGRGGVVLLEAALSMTPDCKRDGVPRCGPDVAVEIHPPYRAAITAASALGVLVVEPAGNLGINLDTDPRTVSLRAFDPPGVDSGALIVGAAQRQLDAQGHPTGDWMPADGSPTGTPTGPFSTSGGLRVNCFAPGVGIVAPGPGENQLTTGFGGTSGASAILAGVAAAVQGVALASGKGRLDGSELRALLADPQYGRAGVASARNPVAIGVMPDLEKLIEGLGVPRLPPATAIRQGEGSVLLMRPRRGDIDQLDILEWREASASWAWWLTSGDDPRVATNGHAVAMHARPHPAGVAVDAVCPTQPGVVLHRPFLLDAASGERHGVDEPWRRLSEPTEQSEAYRVSSPFTTVASADRLLVSGLSIDGTSKIFIAERKPASLEIFPMAQQPAAPGPHEPTFVTLDPFVRFNATPVIHDADGSIVLVGTDTTGTVWFASWTLDLGWSALTSIATGFDPAEAPALAHDGPALHVVGIDPDTGELREIVRSPDAEGLFQWSAMRAIARQSPFVTWGAPLDPTGALAAATDGAGTLIVVGLTAAGLPVATERREGLDWSPTFFIPTLTPFVARAGITLASPTAGVFLAFASDARGALHAARWTLVGWMPFTPV